MRVCVCVSEYALGEANRRGVRDRAAPYERDGPLGHVHCAAVPLHTPPAGRRCDQIPDEPGMARTLCGPHQTCACGRSQRVHKHVCVRTWVYDCAYVQTRVRVGVHAQVSVSACARVCQRACVFTCSECASQRGRTHARVSEIATPSNNSSLFITYIAPPDVTCARGRRFDTYRFALKHIRACS
jgi:hypothetical protein